MRIRWFLFLVFCVNSPQVYSQTLTSPPDFGFIKHLINQEMHNEAIYLLQEKQANLSTFSEGTADSLNYFLGRAAYETKNLEYSSNAFLKVSEQSSFFAESRLFSSYNCLFLSKYDEGFDILNSMPSFHRPLYNELKTFQMAGGALLIHDYKLFSQYASEFTSDFYQLEDEQQKLVDFYGEMTSFNRKSMALAGIMSAIVPGTGKMYAGKAGEGLSALLTNAILGAITVENYLKGGITNPKTIIFGSLFTVFYVGNIYGSMVSVKVYREEYYDSIEKRVLFHLHIPLRTVFNQ